MSSPDTPRQLPWWLHWLPAGALLFAILSYATLMSTVDADPQSGSAFAMFSTVDFANSRRVLAEASIDGTVVTIEAPASLSQAFADLRETPTQAIADKVAAQLHELSWSVNEEGIAEVSDTAAQIDTITVTVFGLVAKGRTLTSEVFAIGTTS